MLQNQIKERIKQAMRSGNTFERDLLKVALGELQTEASRSGTLTDEKAHQLLRKMVKSNQETLDAGPPPEVVKKLRKENALLAELLPKSMSEDEVLAALAPIAAQVKAAGNDGQATGVAMKHLKASNAQADGATVSAAVKKLRAG